MRNFLLISALLPVCLAAQSLIGFGFGKFHVGAPAGVPISDTFNQGSLNTGLWSFVASGGSQSMTGSALQMNVPAASNHDPANGGVDGTVRVAQNIGNVDFTATAKFTSIPTQQYEFEGLSPKQDANSNFLRLNINSNGTSLTCDAWTIIGGAQTGINSVPITGATTAVWLQVQRSGSTWTELYSVDGTNFTNCATFTQALTISQIDIFGGNFNATAANAPAFTVLVDSFTGAGATPPPPPPPSQLCPGSPVTRVSQGHLNAVSGGCYENLHISTTSGDCVTMNNVTNATFHNNEIGPCDSADGSGSNSGMAFNINGGSGNRILDNYIHNEYPCVVNSGCNNGQFDFGDNILCVNSTNLTVQGNVMPYGEDGVEGLTGCHDMTVVGNFILNVINPAVGHRGGAVQNLNFAYNTTVDHNYILNTGTNCHGAPGSAHGINPAFASCTGDVVNFGQDYGAPHGQQDNIKVTNNYIEGGNFAFGCGINFDGGASDNPAGRMNFITGNNLLDTQQCPISIEAGYNYTISNNRVLDRNSLSTTAFQTFACYDFQGGRELGQCSGGIFLPCGNITFSSNLAYSISGSPYYPGNGNPGNACTNVSGAGNGLSGNVWDSGGQGPAYNAMQPPTTQLPVPQIPPVPFSCVVASPFTNNSAARC